MLDCALHFVRRAKLSVAMIQYYVNREKSRMYASTIPLE